MLKEDKEWEEVLQKYENEHDSTERYLLMVFLGLVAQMTVQLMLGFN